MIRKENLALVGICIASFLGCIDLTVVNTIIPTMGQTLNIPLEQMQWISSSFIISLSAFMVIVGKLSDKYGRKILLLTGLIVFGLTSLAIGLSSNINYIVLLRFAQGFGCAILYTVSGSIIATIFDRDKQSKAMGILFGINGVGLAIGPVIGGLLAGLLSWRVAFLINIPFILISIVLSVQYIKESKGNHHDPVDLVGGVLLTMFLVVLVSLLSFELTIWGQTVTLFGLALLAILFIIVERKTSFPIMDIRLFRRHAFSGALLASAFLAFFYSALLLNIPIYLARTFQFSDMATGIMLLLATGSFAIFSVINGRIKSLSAESSILIGLALFVMAAIGFYIEVTLASLWALVIPLILFGIGWAFILSSSTLVALDTFPDEQAGVAMGTSWTLHNLGGASGVAISAKIVFMADILSTGMQQLIVCLGAGAFITLCVCTWLMKIRQS